MNTILSELQFNPIIGIFNLFKKLFLKVTIVYLLSLLALALLLSGVIMIIYGEMLIKYSNSISQFFANLRFMVSASLDDTRGIILFCSSLLFISLVSAWNYAVSFLFAEDFVHNNDGDIGYILKKSFNVSFFRFLKMFFLVYTAIISLVALTIILIQLIGGIAYLVTILLTLFSIRFSLIIPATYLGNMTILKSLSYSLQKITWKRMFKLAGAIILSVVGLGIVFFVIDKLTTLIAITTQIIFLPKLISQLLIGGISISFIIASLTGLYYHFSPTGEAQINTEDHLVNGPPTE